MIWHAILKPIYNWLWGNRRLERQTLHTEQELRAEAEKHRITRPTYTGDELHDR